jgi:NAD-dependent epimerase/dehydratase family protein/GDP-mannose 4,6 dehydratase
MYKASSPGRPAMKTIVTGGAGFIGSNLVDLLVERGDEVHALDDLSKGRRENVNGGAQLHVADIRDPDAVFDAVRPELVFHLAAQSSSRRASTTRRSCSPRRAAPRECDGPAPESAPLRPLAPYGTSKLCGEEYPSTWNRLYGASHVSLRLGNVYGPRQMPHGEASVVAIFMGLLHDGGTPTIFGDGMQSRDYVYVAAREFVRDSCSHRTPRVITGRGRSRSVGGANPLVSDRRWELYELGRFRHSKGTSEESATQALHPSTTRTPPERGFLRADDGTRTHDLLHGKQTL